MKEGSGLVPGKDGPPVMASNGQGEGGVSELARVAAKLRKMADMRSDALTASAQRPAGYGVSPSTVRDVFMDTLAEFAEAVASLTPPEQPQGEER